VKRSTRFARLGGKEKRLRRRARLVRRWLQEEDDEQMRDYYRAESAHVGHGRAMGWW
jgi:hypothetical protein